MENFIRKRIDIATCWATNRILAMDTLERYEDSYAIAGALVHGISKALVLFDENLKATLKTEKLTTRDSRAVERKKPGRRKARRSFQFSKR